MYPAWMGTVCLTHWCVMAAWLALGHHQTAVCSSRCEELMFSCVLGLAYILAFIAPRDGPTRYTYLAYYLVCFMENTGALVVWYVYFFTVFFNPLKSLLRNIFFQVCGKQFCSKPLPILWHGWYANIDFPSWYSVHVGILSILSP